MPNIQLTDAGRGLLQRNDSAYPSPHTAKNRSAKFRRRGFSSKTGAWRMSSSIARHELSSGWRQTKSLENFIASFRIAANCGDPAVNRSSISCRCRHTDPRNVMQSAAPTTGGIFVSGLSHVMDDESPAIQPVISRSLEVSDGRRGIAALPRTCVVRVIQGLGYTGSRSHLARYLPPWPRDHQVGGPRRLRLRCFAGVFVAPGRGHHGSPCAGRGCLRQRYRS